MAPSINAVAATCARRFFVGGPLQGVLLPVPSTTMALVRPPVRTVVQLDTAEDELHKLICPILPDKGLSVAKAGRRSPQSATPISRQSA